MVSIPVNAPAVNGRQDHAYPRDRWLLAEQGIDVALLDADPNATAHRWATQTHEGKAIEAHAEADAERLAALLPSLGEQHAALGCGYRLASATRRKPWLLLPLTWRWCR
jgi:hypothetical protein